MKKKKTTFKHLTLKFKYLSGWEGWGFSEPELIDDSKETVCSDTTKVKHTWTHRNCGNFQETAPVQGVWDVYVEENMNIFESR